VDVNDVRPANETNELRQGSGVARGGVTTRGQGMETHVRIAGETPPEDRFTRTSHLDLELVSI
jgi:hypothetical protein